MNLLMPRWLRWSVLALISWGVWAIMAKLIGAALSGARNQTLSTPGILPIMLAIGVSKRKRVSPPGNRSHGIIYALVAGTISCVGNVAYYDALSRGGKAAMIVPLTALYPLPTILLAMLFLLVAAHAGNVCALGIVRSAGEALGSTIAWLVNVLDPESVIIGGGLGLSEGTYWESIEATARKNIWSDLHRGLPFVRAATGADAGLIGAAAGAWRKSSLNSMSSVRQL
jgi:uncharacterized membrane protein